ncbi:MAG: hypothetical protein ACYTFW_26355, partial [Planctomycetota bacterium]
SCLLFLTLRTRQATRESNPYSIVKESGQVFMACLFSAIPHLVCQAFGKEMGLPGDTCHKSQIEQQNSRL